MGTLFKILPVVVIGPLAEKVVYALLEEGSTVSLINSRVINEIGSKTSEFNAILRGIGSSNDIAITTKSQCRNFKRAFNIDDTDVLVISDLCLSKQRLSKDLIQLCKSQQVFPLILSTQLRNY